MNLADELRAIGVLQIPKSEGRRVRLERKMPEKKRLRVKLYRRKWYRKNADRMKAAKAAWREENREKVRKYELEWAKKNRERVLAARRRDYAKRKEAIRAYNKAWREKNPERIRMMGAIAMRRYRAEHREQINARRRELYRLKKLAAIRERGLRESKAWLKTPTAKRLMSDEALRQYETKEAA